MKLFWVGRTGSAGVGGDYIYDRKTIAAIRAMDHTVDVFEPAQVSRMQEVLGLVTGRSPWYRARFYDAATVCKIRERAAQSDAVICSWEPFDQLVLDLPQPLVLILHNITSQALPQAYPGHRLIDLLARRAGAYEQWAYRCARVDAIVALSRLDQRFVARIDQVPPTVWAPPGSPPACALDAGAVLANDLVLSGTYEWAPKRRDLIRFLEEFAAVQPAVTLLSTDPVADYAPPGLTVPVIDGSFDWGCRIRFGLIPDRFTAGHKLKAMQHICNNCIVLSFADIAQDFADIEDAGLFIIRIFDWDDIATAMQVAARMAPDELRLRFTQFKERCLARFSWQNTAQEVMAAVAGAQAGDRHGSHS